MGKTIPGLQYHFWRKQIEAWTIGRSMRAAAFHGVSENGFRLAKTGCLGANLGEMGSRQRLHPRRTRPGPVRRERATSLVAPIENPIWRAADERKPLYVLVIVIRVTVRGALRFRHEASALVIPYCLQMNDRSFSRARLCEMFAFL